MIVATRGQVGDGRTMIVAAWGRVGDGRTMIVAAWGQVGDGRTMIVPVPPAVLPFILRSPGDDTSVRARPHHVAAP